jgi:hypothetical protein
MDLKQILENKLMWVAGAIAVALLFVSLAGPVIVDRITDKVVERLMKDYSPGPYFPGIDPDKVNPNIWRDKTANKAIRFEPENNWESQWEEQRQ